jgi:alkylhydroperoxidase family enzyme
VADTLLASDGHTDRELRKQVWLFVTAIIEGEDGGDSLPETLRAYLQKLAKHAYKISDDDIAALRNDGYSEDMIFELTASATLAVGFAQMDRGLAVLAAAKSAADRSKGDS